MLRALLLTLVASTAASPAPPSSTAPLRSAWVRHDPVELGQAADRLGTHGLVLALAPGGADRADRLAAMAAASEASESWALLAPLAPYLHDDDRPLAQAAALAVVRIVRTLPPERLRNLGAPVDELAEVAATCAAVAAQGDVWADVRVHALECALGLAAGLGTDAPEAARALPLSLLTDVDPEVRLAAVAFADVDVLEAAAALSASASSDADPRVAGAAAAALCRAHLALPADARVRLDGLREDARVDPGDAASLRACR